MDDQISHKATSLVAAFSIARLDSWMFAIRKVEMKGGLQVKSTAMLILGVAIIISPLFCQEGKMKQEAYTGTAIGTGGAASAKSIGFDFRIDRYTSDEDVDQLATLLKEKGPDALRAAMEKLDVGRINPTGSVGNTIAVARKRQDGSDTIITIVTARVMPFVELYRGGRTTDYPFGFLQVTLNAKGQGSGQIMVAAKIRFDKKKGHFEIESYGNQYIKAVNVRPRS
jgi:hypothetical protein